MKVSNILAMTYCKSTYDLEVMTQCWSTHNEGFPSSATILVVT